MSIAVKTQKMLWGRAANRCSICRRELVMDATETDDESIVGEAAHIVAEKEDGPRGVSPLTREQRDKYANLILLCNIDHKVIDDQVNAYPIERLSKLKQDHEEWVRHQLGFDAIKLRDDEIYAGYLEYWASAMHLDEWCNWASSPLFGGQPVLRTDMKRALDEIRPWLLSRIWPGRYVDLESAFTNFRRVAQDFSRTFGKHAEKFGDDEWQTAKFYKIDEWDPERYRRLAKQFEGHVALVEDLLLELTRAANYICDMARLRILPSFRMSEGALLVQGGPYMDLSVRTYRVEYRGAERTNLPYPGLEEFERKARFTRDYSFGEEGEALE